jgi:hypothetical protein
VNEYYFQSVVFRFLQLTAIAGRFEDEAFYLGPFCCSRRARLRPSPVRQGDALGHDPRRDQPERRTAQRGSLSQRRLPPLLDTATARRRPARTGTRAARDCCPRHGPATTNWSSISTATSRCSPRRRRASADGRSWSRAPGHCHTGPVLDRLAQQTPGSERRNNLCRTLV